MEPEIRYSRTADGVTIAYCETGDGTPFVTVQPMPWSNIDREFKEWEWHRIMAARRRLIRFDNRGTGLSQRDDVDFSLEAMVLDIAAVAEALGLEHVAMYAELHSVPIAIAYAAAHPEHVSHLILHGAYARGADYFAVPRARAIFSLLDAGDWELFTDSYALEMFGWGHADVARHMGEFARSCTTARIAMEAFKAASTYDVTPLLSHVRARTLVTHARGALLPALDMAREVAAGIPGATFRILESPTHWSDALEPQLLAALDELIGDGGRPEAARVLPHAERILPGGLTTILFTDIEGSSALSRRLGDERARAVLREYESLTRDAVRAHGGQEVKTTGDGLMATFSSASRAVQSAIAMQQAFEQHGRRAPDASVRVRIGLNAGEPVADADDLYGAAVDLAARVMAQAAGGEILASNVVRELCADRGFMFADRGAVALKGFEDSVRLWEVRWRTPDAEA